MGLLIALALAAAQAAAPPDAPPPNAIVVGDWTFVGNNATTVLFIKSAPAEGPYTRVYVRFEDGLPFTRDGFSSLAAVEIDDIDCAAQKTRVVESVRYAEHNMTGESHRDPIDMPVWKSETRGSFGAGILAKACAGAI